MLVTDFTLKWISPRRAILEWDGGSVDSWWSIFLNGAPPITHYGSGAMSKEVSLNASESHTVSIVQHAGDFVLQNAPESAKLLRPSIRWLPVDNAAEYIIYELDEDGNEFQMARISAAQAENLYGWQYPVDIYQEGLGNLRIRVYANGSFGKCETPVVLVGLLVGHPPRAASLSVQESSSGLELTIATA